MTSVTMEPPVEPMLAQASPASPVELSVEPMLAQASPADVQASPVEPAVQAPKKPRRKPAPVETTAPDPPPTSEVAPKLQPMFFVELGKTLKDMRRAERTHKISTLKIV